MTHPEIHVQDHEIAHGISYVVRKERGPYDYGNLMEATAKAYDRSGNNSVLFAPYVRFLLDATLEVMKEFNPAARFSDQHEVFWRKKVASAYVAAIDERGVRPFSRIYMRSEVGRIMGRDDRGIFVRRREYTAPLGQSAFGDVSIMAGGAVRLLQAEQPAMSGADIRSTVIASEDLRQLGMIPGETIQEAADTLGNPYINSSELWFDEAAKQVKLTKDALNYLQGLHERRPESGCPAGRMTYIPEGFTQRENPMREGWRDIAAYLVTDQATVNTAFNTA